MYTRGIKDNIKSYLVKKCCIGQSHGQCPWGVSKTRDLKQSYIEYKCRSISCQFPSSIYGFCCSGSGLKLFILSISISFLTICSVTNTTFRCPPLWWLHIHILFHRTHTTHNNHTHITCMHTHSHTVPVWWWQLLELLGVASCPPRYHPYSPW